ncbi:MAG: Gfo/Idh/MocA family protein [Verrucomicrobiales bacterium]
MKKSQPLTRRRFLRHTVGAASLLAFPTIVPASALGLNGGTPPSGRVHIGVIACGGRSRVTSVYEDCEKSEVVAVCDPIRERRLKKLEKHPNAKDYEDFRDVLKLGDVDAVHISTGDHWHVPISLAAARAGKDMYTEKPLGVSVEECLAAREIVGKHKRVFQYGTQNRSMAQLRLGLELVLNGHIGEVKEIFVWAPPGHSGGSATPVLPVPEGYNFDLWLGPAPEAPFCKDRCLVQGPPNGVYHIYDYAIGFIAGWGAHAVDMLQWWADRTGMGIPVEYQGTGTIPSQGLFNTVTNWDVECTYANGLKLRFMDDETRKEAGIPHGDEVEFGHCALFVGSRGWVALTRGGWKVFPETLYKSAKNAGEKRLPVSTDHQRNFIDSVLSREQPVSDLASAVRSDLICHLSDISIRTGRAIRWDPEGETIDGDPGALKMMSRKMRKPWTL